MVIALLFLILFAILFPGALRFMIIIGLLAIGVAASHADSTKDSCKAVIARATHSTTGTHEYIIPDGSIYYFDGANNKTVVCEHGGGCVPRNAVRWLTPCPYDGHWPYGTEK